MTVTVTLKDFITANRISMTAVLCDRNPNNPDWTDADHWKVTFTRREQTGKRYNARKDGTAVVAKLTTYFSMGYGHKGQAPDAESVLDCLSSDASYLDMPFSEWAIDMGYDPDSRKAERIYKACEHGASRLKRFLGDDLYQTLLFGTERL